MVQDAFELHPKPNEKSAPKGSPLGALLFTKIGVKGHNSSVTSITCPLYKWTIKSC